MGNYMYLLFVDSSYEDGYSVVGVFDEPGKREKEREFLEPGCEYVRKKKDCDLQRFGRSQEAFEKCKKTFDDLKLSGKATADQISDAKIAMLQAEEAVELYKKANRRFDELSEEDIIRIGLSHPDGELFSDRRYWFDSYELNETT